MGNHVRTDHDDDQAERQVACISQYCALSACLSDRVVALLAVYLRRMLADRVGWQEHAVDHAAEARDELKRYDELAELPSDHDEQITASGGEVCSWGVPADWGQVTDLQDELTYEEELALWKANLELMASKGEQVRCVYALCIAPDVSSAYLAAHLWYLL